MRFSVPTCYMEHLPPSDVLNLKNTSVSPTHPANTRSRDRTRTPDRPPPATRNILPQLSASHRR
jgi:hypothetical protein